MGLQISLLYDLEAAHHDQIKAYLFFTARIVFPTKLRLCCLSNPVLHNSHNATKNTKRRNRDARLVKLTETVKPLHVFLLQGLFVLYHERLPASALLLYGRLISVN
jgi:hypothetical protein